MTPEQFKTQVERLRGRFGDKAFDNEFVKLVWRVVEGMHFVDFMKCVETFIGSRSHNKPPLLSEFREARLAIEKHRLNQSVDGAGKLLYHPALVKPIAEVLQKDFGAVNSVLEAMEVARLRALRGDKDPA